MKKILILVILLFLTLNVNAAETIIFNDNFSSGLLTGYDTNAGVWSAATNRLVGGALDGSGISHVVAMPGGKTYRFHYTNDPSVGGLNNFFYWMTDQNGQGNENGYRINVQSGGGTLSKMTNGSASILISLGAIATGSMHDINVTHTYDGNIQIWVDGVSKGSVVDSTYNHGSKIIFGTSNGAGNGQWDDVNILYTGDSNTTFKIEDETNPSIRIQASMTINGVPWPVGIDGNFDVNSSISFPATIAISKTGYDDRTFYFDTNAGLYETTALGMRAENQAAPINFTFYGPDESTLLTNRIIAVKKNGILSGRAKTNSSAQTSFDLAPQDSGYTFQIKSAGSDTNIQYTYSSVSVTVNIPKNEITNTNIAPNSFDLDIGGLGLQNYVAQALPISSIVILGNTDDVYTLRVVDNNSNGQQYSARNYIMFQNGDESTLTINPYLVPITDVSLTKIVVKSLAIGNPTIPDIRLQLRTGIGGTDTIVEDQTTNLAGEAVFSFVAQKIYTLIATNGIQTINYFPTSGDPGNISNTSDVFYLFIDFNGTSNSFSTKQIDVNYSPNIDYLQGSSQKVDVNAFYSGTMININIRILDQNVVEYSSICTSSPCNASFNMTLSNFDSNNATIWVQIVTADGNIDRFRNYRIVAYSTDPLGQVRSWRDYLGPLPLALIMFACILLAFKFLGDNEFASNSSRVFIIAIIPAPFIYFWWYDNYWIVISYIAALFGGAGIYLWNRNNGS